MGYCPKCGFRIVPGALACTFCGNQKFYMTVREFWDNCDHCKGPTLARNLTAPSCLVCSGRGVRKYRILKDTRTGVMYYEQFNSLLVQYRELREGQ